MSVREEIVGEMASRIMRDVAELPDRTSPDDQPDMMMVTHKELELIVTREIEDCLTSAGYTIECGWCDDMSLAEIPSPSPLMGKANGVQFLMTWSPGSARLNAAFKDAFGQQAKESPDHPPGWYAWAKGLRCYTRDGKPIQVHPTHWRPITPPNGGE